MAEKLHVHCRGVKLTPRGRGSPGYTSSTTYYQVTSKSYQPTQPTYQTYPYRAAPDAYPFYSPCAPQSDGNAGTGG